MTIDGAGNLFVADQGNHTIRRIVLATGQVTTIAGSPGVSGFADGLGVAATFASPSGVAADGAGNLFVADRDNHIIRKVVLATGQVTTLAGTAGAPDSTDGTGAAARFNRPTSATYDGAAGLFITEEQSIRIRRVTTAGVVTTMVTAPALTGLVATAMDVTAGSLYAVDGNSVVSITVATGAVTPLAGMPNMAGSDDGSGAAARFTIPSGLSLDGAGNLWVSDRVNNTVRRIVIATGAVTTPVGLPGAAGSNDGVGSAARFSSPAAITADRAGSVFVADRSNNTVRKIAIASAQVTTIAGAAAVLDHADGVREAARFRYTAGVAADRSGNVFVADSGNHVIRRIAAATGAVTTIAGAVGMAGSADGTGAAARFNFGSPGQAVLTADGAGNLFVSGFFSNTIRKVVLATGEVTTLAGNPTIQGNADGIGAAALFARPSGIATDGAGRVFIADGLNRTIRQLVVATGEVTTLAGSPTTAGSVDGIGAAAGFAFGGPPRVGLAWDGGNIFVADGTTSIRQVVVATRAVTTLAGGPGGGNADGVGAAARFLTPMGIAADGAGNLLVADSGNRLLRKVSIAAGAVTTVAGRSGQTGIVLGPLPAGLGTPTGVAVIPDGSVAITDTAESAVVLVR
jgi:sugar lactone lactonase YvrE